MDLPGFSFSLDRRQKRGTAASRNSSHTGQRNELTDSLFDRDRVFSLD